MIIFLHDNFFYELTYYVKCSIINMYYFIKKEGIKMAEDRDNTLSILGFIVLAIVALCFIFDSGSGSSISKNSNLNSTTEKELLVTLVSLEAEGDTYEAKVGVASVVLNRMNSSGFPNSITEVIFQANQFGSVVDGQFARSNEHLHPMELDHCRQAVEEALNGYDPTNGSLYMGSALGYVGRNYPEDAIVLGNHVFSKEYPY